MKILTILLFIVFSSTALAKEAPYTLEDRDRLVRLETTVAEMSKRFEQRFESIDKRFEQMDRRFERMENIMMWGFGLIFTSMVGMVGFVLWDRRSALAPAIRKTRELEEREELLERALKEYARMEPRLADVLKSLKVM